MGNAFSGVDDMGAVHDQYFSSLKKYPAASISCGVCDIKPYDYDEPFHKEYVKRFIAEISSKFLLIPPCLVRRFVGHAMQIRLIDLACLLLSLIKMESVESDTNFIIKDPHVCVFPRLSAPPLPPPYHYHMRRRVESIATATSPSNIDLEILPKAHGSIQCNPEKRQLSPQEQRNRWLLAGTKQIRTASRNP